MSAVSMQDVALGYDREIVLSNVMLNLPAGSILALVGANGSGKSTLLKATAGLLSTRAGTIKVFGKKPLSEPSRVSYLSQFHENSSINPLCVLDVVRTGRYALHGLLGKLTANDKDAIDEAIEAMELGPLKHKALNELSGGQKQRVFLAQTFARNADLILLDEPASNLDSVACQRYRQWLSLARKRGASVVIATHDTIEARSCDQVMLLARKVVGYGGPEIVEDIELLKQTFGVVAKHKDSLFVFESEHSHD